MKDSLVTIVVPIYNVEKYLDRCINSIVNQTYKNLQIILVDDASPDTCPEICDEWAEKDSRVSVIHKKNAGLGMARNSGLEMTAGDYVFFVDSDDYLEIETADKCIKRVREDNSDLVMYGFQNEGPDGILSKQIPRVEKAFYDGEEILDEYLPNLIAPDTVTGRKAGLGMSACKFMYSMRLIRQANWKFVSEREIISEDYYSLLDLFSNVHRVSVIKEAFYHYWENTDSLSRSYREDRFFKICDCHKALAELAERRGYPDIVLNSIYSQTLGSIIGALKTINNSAFGYSRTICEYKKIIEDVYFKEFITKIDVKNERGARRILIFCMKSGLTPAIYFMIKLKGRK